ncbi:DNA polymerase beta-like protein, partial [Blyttiomyces helicus]
YKNVRFECCRPHPLRHHNEELVAALKVLERQRELKGEDKNALSYRHAISAFISYPRKISSWREAERMKGVGAKIASKVKEFLQRNRLEEAELIKKSDWFQTVDMFAKVYSVGPKTAQEWYDRGHRTIDDVRENETHLSRMQSIGLNLFDDFNQR